MAEIHSGGTLGGLALTNSYDGSLRRSALSLNTQPASLNYSYGYDSASRLQTVTDVNNGGSATYKYLVNSPLVEQIFPYQQRRLAHDHYPAMRPLIIVVDQHSMRIEVLSYDEHTRQRKAELAAKQDSQKYTYERWAKARNALVERLSNHGVFDSMESGDGDFFVGDDWFETGALHVVLVKWQVLSTIFLQECQRFLVPPYDDFLITVGKSMPAVEDMFQIVVTNQRAYVRFYQRGAEEARAVINAYSRYGAIKALLA